MLTNILQSIGRTPLLRLNALGADLPGTVWLKLENRNPGGSIKDRVAFHVIDKTMEWGDIEAGGTIVEATSGNLGIGIALVAAVRGLHCVLTMPDSMSVERRNLLHALGAELVLTPAAEGMKGAIKVAEKLAEERNGLLFGQFSNPLAVEAHYLTTGPEILADSVGHMDVLVAGVGSGSSITGTGRFLKENIPGFKVMAVEPAESPVLSGGQAGRGQFRALHPGPQPAGRDHPGAHGGGHGYGTPPDAPAGRVRGHLHRRQRAGRPQRGRPSRDAGQEHRDLRLRYRRTLHVHAPVPSGLVFAGGPGAS